MKLLLDLGNTRLKWMCADAGTRSVGAVEARAWADATRTVLLRDWQPMSPPQRVVAASVVDTQREQFVAAAVQERFGMPVEWLRTPAAACGVRNAYAEPGRLGADRFAAMLAAYAEQRAPCILASCGTALTLDALAIDGRHLGGLIAPGPPLMQQALLGATARVRADAVPGRIVDAADNSTDALVSGCWQAAAALVERFSQRMGDALGGAPSLLLGGGDAGPLRELLGMPAQLYPHAVLRGVAVWADAPR